MCDISFDISSLRNLQILDIYIFKNFMKPRVAEYFPWIKYVDIKYIFIHYYIIALS